jgi:mycothiol synthase
VIETSEDATPVASLPSLRFRQFRGPEDYAGMVAANMAARLAAGVEEIVTLEGLEVQYAHLTNSDVADDLRIIELDGQIVGYVRVEWIDQNDGSRSYDMVCLLRPDLREQGIGGAMLRWAEARIHEIAADHPDDRTRWIGAENWDADGHAISLLTKNGYTPVRTFFEMNRPTLDDLPEADLPDGFEIRAVDRGDLRALWVAEMKAFRDHWGGVDESEAGFERYVGEPNLDPSLLVVAFAGEEIAGAVRNEINDAENEQFRRRRGLLASVFVRRPYRRRGLARALILRSLSLLAERGMTSATLGVDADNPYAALDLYESCGFERGLTSTSWRKPLDQTKEADR